MVKSPTASTEVFINTDLRGFNLGDSDMTEAQALRKLVKLCKDKHVNTHNYVRKLEFDTLETICP